VFCGIIQLTACHALEQAMKEFYNQHAIDLNRLVILTSDDASVMLGRWNGLAALLKRTVPNLSDQHCVAHREDLALTASWKDNNLLKNIEVLLCTVYTLFSRSSVETAALAELASVNEVDVLSFRPIQEVRWLSRHFTVSAFVRNVDALVLFCEEQINECNDPICTYVLRSIQDPQYLLALYTLNDVLNESANLLKVLYHQSKLTSCAFLSSQIRSTVPWLQHFLE